MSAANKSGRILTATMKEFWTPRLKWLNFVRDKNELDSQAQMNFVRGEYSSIKKMNFGRDTVRMSEFYPSPKMNLERHDQNR